MVESKTLVLVTGGSGFLGAWCIVKLLEANYRVRTTVRSLKREDEVREMVKAGGAPNLHELSFVEADLCKDAGWAEAVAGCTYVLHVASPVPAKTPKNDDEVVVPAREGTLRVLRAARDARVERIVVTSSIGAIAWGHRDWDVAKEFDEGHWTDVEGPGVNAYIKSKALAERAAWRFIEEEGGNLEMCTVNPAFIWGPTLGVDSSSSVEIIQRLMNGSLPGCPDLTIGIVDVRDVADLHLLAMTHPRARGERLICSTLPLLSIHAVSLGLRDQLGRAAKKCPTRKLPSFVVRLVGWVDSSVALIVPELGAVKQLSIAKATSLVGWQPKFTGIDAAVAAAESLIKFGVVKA